MNKQLLKLVDKLNEKTAQNYKLVLYTDGYGLSQNNIIVASGIKNIKLYIHDIIDWGCIIYDYFSEKRKCTICKIR